MLSTSDKVFLNIKGATHNEPIQGHRASPLVSAFAKLYALAEEEERDAIFSMPPDSILVAEKGDKNSPEAYGYLACGSDGVDAVPAESANFCAPFNFPMKKKATAVGAPEHPPLWGGSQQVRRCIYLISLLPTERSDELRRHKYSQHFIASP